MKKFFRVIMLGVLLTLGACGSGTDAGKDEKNLFSVWTENQSGLAFDLTGGWFNSYMPMWYVDGCTNKLKFVGSQSSGMFIETGYSNCYLDGQSIPYGVLTTGTYSKSNSALVFTIRTYNGASIGPFSLNFH